MLSKIAMNKARTGVREEMSWGTYLKVTLTLRHLNVPRVSIFLRFEPQSQRGLKEQASSFSGKTCKAANPRGEDQGSQC